MTTVDPEAHIAERFTSARREGRALDAFPGDVPTDLASAYRAQDLAIARWDQPIGGWKATAALPPDWVARLGEPRAIGPVFVPTIREAGSDVIECPVFEGGLIVIEPELVVRVGRDAAPDQVEWTIDEAAEMVGTLHVGIEIASSPLSTLLSLGVTAVVSDFGANFGIVVGPPIPDWRAADRVSAECFLDGVSVGKDSKTVREAALEGLAFVLGKAARRGLPLRAGATITTGVLTFAHHARIGQTARIVYDGIGEISCRLIAARPEGGRA